MTKIQQKQEYLLILSAFLTETFLTDIDLKIDENEYVTGTYNYNTTFEYSVWGDNNNGMFRDTLRALIREGFMEEL